MVSPLIENCSDKPGQWVIRLRFVNTSLDLDCDLDQITADSGECHLRTAGIVLADRKAMAKKVMIVEDNELNMKLFRDLIEASGYETVQTRNGLEALDLARAHKPDLILMDIQLPEVSGLEVTNGSRKTMNCTSSRSLPSPPSP